MKKHSWEEFFAKHSEKNAKPYNFGERYTDNVIVTHPKFGKGFVTEVMSDSKVEITFKDSRRVLVHNRKDMPGLPLAAEGDGRPSTSKVSAKGAKGKAVPAKAPAKVVPAKAVKEAPAAKPVHAAHKETAPAAKILKNRAKVPPKTSPAAKAGGGGKRTAKPARAVRPATAAVKHAKPAAKPAPKKKAKGKK